MSGVHSEKAMMSGGGGKSRGGACVASGGKSRGGAPVAETTRGVGTLTVSEAARRKGLSGLAYRVGGYSIGFERSGA